MPENNRPLEFIKQTSKAILFEKFNSSPDNLYTIIKNEDVRDKSEFFKIIEDKLEVRSFEEFAEKFMPSVWEWYEVSDDPNCNVNFRYSLEKPDGISDAHEMKLDKNEFYSMVMHLYENKGSSGESNLEFDYSDVAKLLSPNKVLERAKDLRTDLEYNYNKLLDLEKGSKSKQEMNKCIRQINSIRQEIVSQYKDSITGVIKLALADTQQKLLMISADNDNSSDQVTVLSEPRKQLKLLGFTNDGELDIREVNIQDNNSDINHSDEANSKILQLVENDYDKYNNKGEFVKNLITSTYCNTQLGVLPDREELTRKRDMYTMLYKNSQEQFIRAISSAIEKVLNVKAFFEQATTSGNKKLPASLIVSNCSVEKLLNEEVKGDFEYFLKETSREPDTGKIWFAIVPAIGDADFVDNLDEDVSLDDLFVNNTENVNNVKTSDGDELTSLAALKVMLGILKNAQIMTFFNFRANEMTGFGKLNASILEKYKEKLEPINGNHYAVFAYPNFTVLPKKETCIEIGKASDAEGNEMPELIDIPGIYIDASYVAAGLVVASQNPDYLAEKFSRNKVRDGYPCVRFDFERKDNRFIMLTKMNREGKVTWSSEVEDDISKDKFGFCFCGNTKYYNKNRVNNTYVFTARNMNKENDGQYEPLYKCLTMDFVKQYLRVKFSSASGNRINTSDVESFIKEDVGQWRREAEDDYENNILRSVGGESENIEIDNESGKLKITFQGTATEMDIDIIKE